VIYTITLNPAIDYVFETESFDPEHTNYYQNNYEVVGGKGINVAIALKHLGVEKVIATGLLGSKNIGLFRERFKDLKLKEKFFEFNGKTRINYKIMNLVSNKETKVNGEADVSDLDGVKLLDFLDRNLVQNDLVVVSGSVPRAITPMIYFQIGQIAKRNQALFILDSSKIWFRKALKSHPFLIKQTVEEMCDLLKVKKRKDYSLTDLKKMIYDLQKLGAQNVLVTLDDNGSIYFEKSSNSFYKVNIFSSTIKTSIDANDRLLAGFVYGLVNNLPIEETLKYAVACGATTALNRTMGEQKDIANFYREVNVRHLKNLD
jgi:1-phosphofructokinase